MEVIYRMLASDPHAGEGSGSACGTSSAGDGGHRMLSGGAHYTINYWYHGECDTPVHIPSESSIVLLLAIFLFYGSFLLTVKHKLIHKLTYTPFLILGGILAYLSTSSTEDGSLKNSIKNLMNIDPHGLLTILAPIILF